MNHFPPTFTHTSTLGYTHTFARISSNKIIQEFDQRIFIICKKIVLVKKIPY